MRHPCPNPFCCEGRSARISVKRPSHLALERRSLRCPICRGTGSLGESDERDEDLRSAGIVLDGATEEDFRSSPVLWQP